MDHELRHCLVESWVKFLSQPMAEFGGMPACPFAASARWAVYSHPRVADGLREGERMFRSGCFDVLIFDSVRVTKGCYDGLLKRMAPDIAVLVSDSDRPYIAGGVRTTPHDGLLFMFQWREKLTEARRWLAGTRYYD